MAADRGSGMQPRVTDDDKDQITVDLNGRQLRGWSYSNDAERRQKMLQAREFAEGWFQAAEHLRGELEYAYRAIKSGFEFGNFDFTVLRQRADHVIDGKPLPPHLR